MLKKELTVFLLVGGSTVLVDFAFYHIFQNSTSWSIDIAKTFSFIVGTVYAYFANKYWTFGHNKPQGAIILFALLYLISLGANVTVNSAVLYMLGAEVWQINVAFVVATGVSAVMNFLGMKFFVFKQNKNSI